MGESKLRLSAARVKRIRDGLKLSQAGLGRKLGVGATTIRYWESGLRACKGPAAHYLLVLELVGPTKVKRGGA